VVNVPAQVVPPEVPGVYVPGDLVHPGDTLYNAASASTPANLPPNGAGAGRTALINDTTGAIDWVRSSSFRAATDTAQEEFYAFALDAADWVYFPGNPVRNLSQQDLINIYTCSATTHLPIVSNWNQISSPVADFSGPIKKYQAQLSSGRQKSFETTVLAGHAIDENCDASHLSPRLEESNATGIAAADLKTAIYFYGYSSWQQQFKFHSTNLKNGAGLGQIRGKLPSKTTINTSATRFLGTQVLWNVAKTTSPSYAKVIKFLGETPTGNGYICAGKANALIENWGLVTFPNAVDPVTGHASYCRKEFNL
jgi:hypothetical protein